MENVRIKKAKIKDGLFLEAEYTIRLEGHAKNDQKLNSTVPIHEDLKNAFQLLTPHLALLCDVGFKLPRGKSLEDLEAEDYEKFDAKGFVLAGADLESFMLIGSLEGKYGTTHLNSPLQKWELTEYPHHSDLHELIERCTYEVKEYIFNGKRAPDKQLELDMDDHLPENADKIVEELL